MESNIISTGKELGKYLDKKYSLGWTPASQIRTGNALRQWAEWFVENQAGS